MFTLKNRKLKAAGLIEILIAMVIFAIAIVAITSLNAKNYRQIKANEITDLANKLMVSSLEYLKAPTTNTLEGNGIQEQLEAFFQDDPTKDYICIRVDGEIDSNDFNITKVTCPNDPLTSANRLKFDECTNGSEYLLDSSIGSGLEGITICNQIVVEKQLSTSVPGRPDGYKIISRVVYKTPIWNKDNESYFYINEIFGFRPFTFEQDD